MNTAIIDIGTNTFHLVIAQIDNGAYKTLLKERIPVRLGEKGINENEITEEAQSRAIDALKIFQKKIKENSVEKIYALATSAVRSAKNKKSFIQTVKDETGIEIEIISGNREAELILEGVKQVIDFNTSSLVMDIGGGSVEFILVEGNKINWMGSFEIGGQRLAQLFHKNDPITQTEINQLLAHLDEKLEVFVNACKTYRPHTLVGCSGTFETFSKIYCANQLIDFDENAEIELPFDFYSFKTIYNKIITKNKAERLKIEGMSPMRADLIVVASILVQFVLENTHIADIRVSPFALKEGIIQTIINSNS